MEQEKEVTDTRQVSREAFEIEGIGEFRAKPGTAVYELAGAASYWEREAKGAHKLVEKHGVRRWRDGFTAGMSVSFAIVLVVAGAVHFLIH